MTTTTAVKNSERTLSPEVSIAPDRRAHDIECGRDQRCLGALLNAIALRHSSADAATASRQFVDVATEGLAVTSVTLYLYDKSDRLLHPVATSARRHRNEILAVLIALGDGLAGGVARTRQPRIVNHAEKDPDSLRIPGIPLGPESLMAAPLVCDEQITGVLLASKEGNDEFHDSDLDWLKVYACLASSMIHESALKTEIETERQNMRNQLLHAEKMRVLGEMAGGVFHDINNILGAVVGRVEMMQVKTEDDESKKALSQIEKIALQGAATVKRLQEFARSHQDQDPGPVNLGQVIEDALEVTRHRWETQAQQKGITYRIDRTSGRLKAVRGVHTQLVDAVANLILNALDAMPQGGTLTLATACVPEGCQLCISDTGVGMSPDQIELVFSPFFTTKGPRGTGLGLTVVRDIIERHEGQIDLESHQGVGTKFRIVLPLETPEQVASDTKVRPEEPAGLRLLLVDDDHTILDVVAEALQDAGHRVDTFDNGADAVTAIEKNTYDVVVTDLGMPDVTGWDVARAAKLHQPRLPVLVISGWGAQYGEGQLADTGIDAMLAKPFHLQQLRENVERLAKTTDMTGAPGR